MAFQNDLIEKAEAFLNEKYSEGLYLNENPSQKAYRLEHSYRVANICKTIAQQEGLDETALTIAGLLHDVSYCLEFSKPDDWTNHGRASARLVRPFLESLGLSQEQIMEICYGIAIHVDDQADFEGDRTPFALSVGDADNIDRFDAYRIYEGLQLRQFSEHTLEEKREHVHSVLSQLDKLKKLKMGTKTAETIWLQRLDFYAVFYEKLKSQLDNSSGIL